jgi:hypothetical protein
MVAHYGLFSPTELCLCQVVPFENEYGKPDTGWAPCDPEYREQAMEYLKNHSVFRSNFGNLD